jgi:hypothetical protein
MILRDVLDLPRAADASRAAAKRRNIWDALFEHQSKLNGAKECWLITQPSHSALSGEIAAKLRTEIFGAFDEATLRAIALHDAGWSASDSEQIKESRSQPMEDSHPIPAKNKSAGIRMGHDRTGKNKVAISFLGVAPKEAVGAWTGSVETALKASPLGGLLVSEHFRSIAQFQVKENRGKSKEMAAFARQEEVRQAKLRSNIGLDPSAIERLVDGLRFTDLLSLYLCAGLTEPVEFPQVFQQHTFTLAASDQGIYQLRPFPFESDQTFSFAALRHPRTKTVSSASFLCKVTG